MITLGLCLPASCAINELIFILERIFRDRIISIDDVYSTDFRLIQVKDLKDHYEWLFSGAFLFVWYVSNKIVSHNYFEKELNNILIIISQYKHNNNII